MSSSPPPSQFLPQGTAQPEIRPQNRRGLIILGMHRSGTSALAGTLGKLGGAMPLDLMGAGIGNDKGHWEPAGIVAVNDRILESAGSHWEDWDRFNPDWYASALYPPALEDARTALRTSFADAPFFIMKDPRVCRLVPFWTNVFALESIDPAFLLCLRHPAQVAASLAKRDGMEPGYAGLLWLRHTLEAEVETRGRKRTICDFDQLLGNWSGLVKRLGSDLGVIWPRRSAQMRHEMDQFLSSSSSIRPSIAMPVVMPWAIEAYTILRRWAEQGEDRADHAKLDAIFQQFNSASDAFSDLILPGSRSLGAGGGHALRDELENMRAALAAATEERENTVRHLQDQIRDAVEARENVSTVLSDRDAHIAALHGEMEGLRQREAAHAQTQAERDSVMARLGELEAELHAATHSSADMASILSDRDAHIAALHGEMEALRQREDVHAQMQAERDSVMARMEELAAELHTATHSSADTAASLAMRDAQVAILQTELEKAQSGLADMQLRNEHNAEAARQSAHQIAMLENRLRQRDEEIEQTCRERDEARKEATQLEVVQARLKKARADIFEIAADRREYQVAAERAERAVQNLERRLHGEQAARASSSSALSATRARIADLMAELDQARQDMEELLADKDALLHAKQRAHAHMAALETQLKSARGQAARDETEKQELKAALSRAETDIASLYDETATINQQRADAEARYARLSHDHHHQDEHVQKLVQKLLVAEERFATHDNHAKWLHQVNSVLIDSPRWWSFIPSGWRRRRQLERLKESGLFDGRAYLALNHDVAAAGADPLRHYLDHGMAEGRQLPR
ncbi:hypothetical protein K3M67_21585 (plasmid) [Sphingobium sp. V4]|uniref:hypothetical protein n=1 Tax=Sphingobium sp. V4 TaxID=3038927 RepID=UPI002557D9CB|nr:hypothetical protein [Sphingobium sp. V4]WIW91126.1 hypothetical protein K3M67_21585 [Sphingobium sp. V4]